METKFELMGFDFNKMSITTIVDEHKQAWFIGKEIANILGYADTKKAIKQHIEEDDKKKFTNKELEGFLRGDKTSPLNFASSSNSKIY